MASRRQLNLSQHSSISHGSLWTRVSKRYTERLNEISTTKRLVRGRKQPWQDYGGMPCGFSCVGARLRTRPRACVHWFPAELGGTGKCHASWINGSLKMVDKKSGISPAVSRMRAALNIKYAPLGFWQHEIYRFLCMGAFGIDGLVRCVLAIGPNAILQYLYTCAGNESSGISPICHCKSAWESLVFLSPSCPSRDRYTTAKNEKGGKLL
jgi:hypothetical protein